MLLPFAPLFLKLFICFLLGILQLKIRTNAFQWFYLIRPLSSLLTSWALDRVVLLQWVASPLVNAVFFLFFIFFLYFLVVSLFGLFGYFFSLVYLIFISTYLWFIQEKNLHHRYLHLKHTSTTQLISTYWSIRKPNKTNLEKIWCFSISMLFVVRLVSLLCHWKLKWWPNKIQTN